LLFYQPFASFGKFLALVKIGADHAGQLAVNTDRRFKHGALNGIISVVEPGGFVNIARDYQPFRAYSARFSRSNSPSVLYSPVDFS
jgi:hypothetical protein